jgi:hypothetical protein
MSAGVELLEPVNAFTRCLAGNWSQGFRFRAPRAGLRRAFVREALARVEGQGLVGVTHECAGETEAELLHALHASIAALGAALAPSATEAFFLAEMLAVTSGGRTLGSVSFEARARLAELEVYDPWTGPQGLADGLTVLGDLACQVDRGAVFILGEAQRLRDRPREQDWPLATLLGAFKHSTATHPRRLLLCLAGSEAMVARMAQSDPDTCMMFEGASLS